MGKVFVAEEQREVEGFQRVLLDRLFLYVNESRLFVTVLQIR